MIDANKVKGALYGFALGDAMGATTEFMAKADILNKWHLGITDITGGGWLHLKAGEVTDDTQMMLCVGKALSEEGGNLKFLNGCKTEFIKWFNTRPVDIGGQCYAVLSKAASTPHVKSRDLVSWATSLDAQGNGALMRCLPCCLIGDNEKALLQGELTHNNEFSNKAITQYFFAIQVALAGTKMPEYTHMAPTGHCRNSVTNAMYWSYHMGSVYDTICEASTDGGDADTIAALAGGLSGAYYGFNDIPDWLVKRLNCRTSQLLDALTEKLVGIASSTTKKYF